MSILKEIVDGITIVADSINNIKEIHTAIKDGKKYFEKAHPEIKKDVSAMCNELRKTCNAISTAASIITTFRFDSSPGTIEAQPRIFNNYFMKYINNKNEAQDLIYSLKGHCSIVKQHAENISKGNTSTFWTFFGLQSAQRELELAAMLEKIYSDEQDFYSIVHRMADCMNKAIEDVMSTLCENGMMTSTKVPDASIKLLSYAKEFKTLELVAKKIQDELDTTIIELQ